MLLLITNRRQSAIKHVDRADFILELTVYRRKENSVNKWARTRFKYLSYMRKSLLQMSMLMYSEGLDA